LIVVAQLPCAAYPVIVVVSATACASWLGLSCRPRYFLRTC
jgi:hypothetical protein